MEIVNMNIVGYYSYQCNLENKYYDEKPKYHECIICKRTLYEPGYDVITDNKHLTKDYNIVIGKCGHIFHQICLDKWLNKCDTCPIDKVRWCLHTIADTTIYDNITKCNKYNKYNKYNKS
jgi:hypothetical protein